MKKFLFMFALFMGVVSANAQIATHKSNALDNISIGVTAGVSTPLDFNSMFPLNTNVGIRLQKDFTTVFGLQVEGIAILNDNHFSNIKTAVKATNVGLNGVFNLSNIFWGYKGVPRTFEISAVTGLGWAHYWNQSANFLTAKTGFDLAFNLGEKKALSIVLTPAIYWNLSKDGKVNFNKKNAQLAVNVSLVYHFKNSNGTHYIKTYDIGAMNDEINRLKGALEECESRELQVKVVEKVVEPQVDNTAIVKADSTVWVVTFATASAELSTEAMYILNQVGTNAVVDVTATASPDGSAKFNQKLSEKRADAVAKFLTKRGVNVKSAVGKGVSKETGKSAIVKTVQ